MPHDCGARVQLVPSFECPYCGEPTDAFPDLDGGERQILIEDCVVCCRPIRVVATYSEASGEFGIEASAA
ncbi:MAG: CPXCG motif-containing cysteine-rich protein [Polyangiaceae bacterium]|nr:CPXCG motif-containing cysteine-rich protein [Polyangiaceae bacterium]